MLDELKNLKTSLRHKDILYFLQSVIGHHNLSMNDLRTIWSHAPGQHVLDADTLLAYCVCFDLVTSNKGVKVTEDVQNLLDDTQALSNFLLNNFIAKLFVNQILTADLFAYDIEKQKYRLKNERIPLQLAYIRNLLIDFGFLNAVRTVHYTKIFVNPQYEEMIQRYCKPKKKTIDIEKLRKKIAANNMAGEKAELFVLNYEKRRIKSETLRSKIRLISDIDVCAGYDIISFDTENSNENDRFIEVKATSADLTFFLSSNELETAKLRGKNYYLYLVELQKIHENNYVPMIICNPASVLFSSEKWLLEPQTYKIKHV